MKNGRRLLGWIISIVLIAAMAVCVIFLKNGIKWSIPEELIGRFDFDQMNEMIDQMRVDGYNDLSNRNGEQSKYYLLVKADGDSATPLIYLEWERNWDNSKIRSLHSCEVKTTYAGNMNGAAGNKYGYRYCQEVNITFDRGNIWMIYYTKHLFKDRQLVIDYLDDFCDRYCSADIV